MLLKVSANIYTIVVTMKTFIVAVVLLGTFALAQARGNTVVIEDANDLNSDTEAKDAFCGIVQQCRVSTNYSEITKKYLDTLNRLKDLEKDVDQLKKYLQAVTPVNNRYANYKRIADLQPVFWLSGSFFDGLRPNVSLSRTGLAPLTDILYNPVTKIGSVQIINDRGNMAYYFDKTNSITSTVAVHKKFTFVTVFRFPVKPTGVEGRFFTSTDGNKFFAGWTGYAQELYMDGWVNNNHVASDNVVILIGTNDNGVKNLWSHTTHLVKDSTLGVNDWGRVIIGLPIVYPLDAAKVNVYEAIVFDKVLDSAQRSALLSVFKQAYGFN